MKRSQILFLCVPLAVVLLLAGELMVRKNGVTATTAPSVPPATGGSSNQVAPARFLAPLAQTQLQKLLALNTSHGQDQEVAPDIAAALGLTGDNSAVPVRQLSVVNGTIEAVSFGVFKDNRAGYVFAGRNATEMYAFYVDEKLNLVAAAKRSPLDSPATLIPGPEAKETFREVSSIWARIADSPPSRGKTTGGP